MSAVATLKFRNICLRIVGGGLLATLGALHLAGAAGPIPNAVGIACIAAMLAAACADGLRGREKADEMYWSNMDKAANWALGLILIVLAVASTVGLATDVAVDLYGASTVVAGSGLFAYGAALAWLERGGAHVDD